MEIRGTRECTDCGRQWSYYETGSVACPDCGSVHSVGVETDRTLHTDAPVDLDLTPVRGLVDGRPLDEVAEATAETARAYTRKRGFVRGGELLELDETYLAASELAVVATTIERTLEPSDDEEWFFLELLRVADRGERPDPDDVPDSLRDARGLAYATAVRTYRREVSSWLDRTAEAPGADFAPGVLESLAEHGKRLRALQGDVPPAVAEALVCATRDLGAYLRAEDPDGLASCRARLEGLEDID